jgi:predicted O-methyltransferase YrrM
MSTMTINNIVRTLCSPLHRWYALRRIAEYHRSPRSLEEIIHWGMDFGCKGFYKIRAQQLESEISRLAQFVAALTPKNILEIGTGSGGTLVIWAALASHQVISCDCKELKRLRPLLEAMPPPGSRCQIKLLTGDSHSASLRMRVLHELQGEMVDFLYIDGDHAEMGVKQDWENYHGLVRRGGLIAFHDIVEKQPSPFNQVATFWKTIRQNFDTEEVIADRNQCGYGIGIVRVP